MMSSEIARSVELRAQGKYEEVIQVIEKALSTFDEETRQVALMQAFYAARHGKLTVKAREFAKRIAQREPDTPSIQEYLK